MSGQASYAFLINLICLGATAIDPASTVSTTNSPVRLQATMPAPAGINSLCLDEWSGHKELILQKRDSLYYAILDKEKLNTSREKIQQEIALLKQRWLLLDNVIKKSIDARTQRCGIRIEVNYKRRGLYFLGYEKKMYRAHREAQRPILYTKPCMAGITKPARSCSMPISTNHTRPIWSMKRKPIRHNLPMIPPPSPACVPKQ